MKERALKSEIDRPYISEEFAEADNDILDNLKFDRSLELPIPSEGRMVMGGGQQANDPGFAGAIDSISSTTTAAPTDSKLPSLEAFRKERAEKSATAASKSKKPAKKEEPAFVPIEEYDLTSLVLGEGRPVLGIQLPYLQSGHTILLLVTLLSVFIDYPGLPLTELPADLKGFLKQGLINIYAINTVLAVLSISLAKKREQNIPVWFVKTFVLGGLSYNELRQIKEKDSAAV